MCTCITYKNSGFFFGRNLDLDCSFGETVMVAPRNFPLRFRNGNVLENHYAMIGMAAETDVFPLYADAVNEKGLAMAGLNFPGNAKYRKPEGNGLELASFEMIAWTLARYETVDEAVGDFADLVITDTAFAKEMPPAPLHWMLADSERCVVIEQTEDGLKIFENPAGVLTNNPTFDFHMMNLNNYLNLTRVRPENRFSKSLDLKPFAEGMGAMGLPGDYSSVSRFVKAAFLKANSAAEIDEKSDVSQFFHILDAVAMVRGSVITEKGTYDITTYSCCMNAREGAYMFKTYDDSRIRTANMYDEDIDGNSLIKCRCGVH